MKKILFLSTLCLGFLGCAKTTYNYYYASLEHVAGMEVVSRGKVGLKNLKYNSDIPKEYTLHREGYSLNFVIRENSYNPNFRIFVQDLSDGNILKLRGRRDKNIVSANGSICASYYPDNKNPSILDFGWSPGCISEEIQKQISLDVVDMHGQVVGEENISFVLKRDGQYTLLDAL